MMALLDSIKLVSNHLGIGLGELVSCLLLPVVAAGVVKRIAMLCTKLGVGIAIAVKGNG